MTISIALRRSATALCLCVSSLVAQGGEGVDFVPPGEPWVRSSELLVNRIELQIPSQLGEEFVAKTIRGQSPEISLLPLADGKTLFQETSYLTPITLSNGRLSGNYVTDFDDTSKIGGQILTQGGLGLGIDAEANYWQRPVEGLGNETLWTGDLNMMYSLSPIERFKVRSGAGGSWMIDQGNDRYGYNITHGVDIYTLWRMMFTGEIDWGKIEDDKVFRYRLGVGMSVKSFDLYTGFESQKIGNEKLYGWMNGIILWY